MLLVDDDEPQLLELHVGLDQSMRADDEIDAALDEPVQHCLRFLAGAKARQLGELDRQVGEAVGKCLEVLLGEQRRRHQDCDLLAVGQGDERGAQRNLGLAETDVAADETVHRLAGDEIFDHRLDRPRLIGRLLERKTGGEGFVIVDVEPEGVALARSALGIEVQKLCRGIVCALRGLAFRLVPLPTAELVQRGRLGGGAAVAADDVEARDRHVELGIVGIEQVQEFVRPVAEIERSEAEVAADAVLFVDDRVADAHLGEVAQHRLDVGPARVAPGGSADDVGVELGFGDERDAALRPEESGVRRADRKRGARVAANELGPVGDDGRLEAVLREVLLHGFTPAQAVGDDQHALAGRGREALERVQRIAGAAIDLQRRKCLRCSFSEASRRLGQLDPRERLEGTVELIDRQEQLVRRQQRARRVAA